MLDWLGLSHSAGQIAFVLFAAVVAGLARGFSGFGAALIFVPLASAAIGPRLAVPLLLVADAIVAWGMIPNAWRTANRPEVGIMSVGALVGVPIGTFILKVADPLMRRWAIALLVFGLLVLLISGWRYRGLRRAWLTASVGGAAGFLSGAAQVGGPPVVVYWLTGANTHHVVRANLVLFFAISTVISIVSYVAGGLIVADVLRLSLIVAPVFGVSLLIGSYLFGRADEAIFRRICYALIAVAAFAGLPLWDRL